MVVEVERNDIEKAIKNLKRKMANEGFFKEIKKRRYYEKPSERKKRKREEARRRRLKRERMRRKYSAQLALMQIKMEQK